MLLGLKYRPPDKNAREHDIGAPYQIGTLALPITLPRNSALNVGIGQDHDNQDNGSRNKNRAAGIDEDRKEGDMEGTGIEGEVRDCSTRQKERSDSSPVRVSGATEADLAMNVCLSSHKPEISKLYHRKLHPQCFYFTRDRAPNQYIPGRRDIILSSGSCFETTEEEQYLALRANNRNSHPMTRPAAPPLIYRGPHTLLTELYAHTQRSQEIFNATSTKDAVIQNSTCAVPKQRIDNTVVMNPNEEAKERVATLPPPPTMEQLLFSVQNGSKRCSIELSSTSRRSAKDGLSCQSKSSSCSHSSSTSSLAAAAAVAVASTSLDTNGRSYLTHYAKLARTLFRLQQIRRKGIEMRNIKCCNSADTCLQFEDQTIVGPAGLLQKHGRQSCTELPEAETKQVGPEKDDPFVQNVTVNGMKGDGHRLIGSDRYDNVMDEEDEEDHNDMDDDDGDDDDDDDDDEDDDALFLDVFGETDTPLTNHTGPLDTRVGRASQTVVPATLPSSVKTDTTTFSSSANYQETPQRPKDPTIQVLKIQSGEVETPVGPVGNNVARNDLAGAEYITATGTNHDNNHGVSQRNNQRLCDIRAASLQRKARKDIETVDDSSTPRQSTAKGCSRVSIQPPFNIHSKRHLPTVETPSCFSRPGNSLSVDVQSSQSVKLIRQRVCKRKRTRESNSAALRRRSVRQKKDRCSSISTLEHTVDTVHKRTVQTRSNSVKKIRAEMSTTSNRGNSGKEIYSRRSNFRPLFVQQSARLRNTTTAASAVLERSRLQRARNEKRDQEDKRRQQVQMGRHRLQRQRNELKRFKAGRRSRRLNGEHSTES